jgi:hypothetical protein
MTWNLGLIEQFYKNRMSEPAEYERLIAEDPIGKMWNGYREAEKAFHEAKDERAALGYGDSINPARTAELAEQMPVLLERRRKMLEGLSAACHALGNEPQPDVRYLQTKITGLRRGRGDQRDIAALEGLIASLENIAAVAFGG